MKKRKNFTLIEILVVIGIIGLLTAIGTTAMISHMKSARIKTAQAQIAQFTTTIVSFEMDLKRLPDPNVGLKELVENISGSDKWKGPYIELEEIPLDPWDHEYVYTVETVGLRCCPMERTGSRAGMETMPTFRIVELKKDKNIQKKEIGLCN